MITRPTIYPKYLTLILWLFVLAVSLKSNAQSREWEFDKTQERERVNKITHDSIMNHLKNKVSISVGYGTFRQIANKINDEDVALVLPDKMNGWQLSLAWYPNEQFVVRLNSELRIGKDIPTPPRIISIINGDEIEIEGGGVGMIPIELGINYYLLKNIFRPYIGLSGGVGTVKSLYVEVRGNISDGVVRSGIKQSETLKLISFNAGFDYRLGERVNAGLGIRYQCSSSFKNMSAGYKAISGVSIAPYLSILLF